MLFGFLFAIFVSVNSKFIELNVGGEIIATSTETLQSKDWFIGSIIARYVDNDTSLPIETDPMGRIFIDADPMYFKQIVNYCRYNKLIIPSHLDEQQMEIIIDFFSLKIGPQNNTINRSEKSLFEKIKNEFAANHRIPKVIVQMLSMDACHMKIKLSPTVFDTEQNLNDLFGLKHWIDTEQQYSSHVIHRSRVATMGRENSTMSKQDVVDHFRAFFPMYTYRTERSRAYESLAIFELNFTING
eukprot:731595_1